MRQRVPGLLFFALTFVCAFSGHAQDVDDYSFALGEKAADTAVRLLGKPYRFRGDSPAGFDCSGLVQYSYRTAGMDVPRDTSALRESTYPISARDIRRGDLLFFTGLRTNRSHVGISLGDDLFVHAPSRGKAVRIDSLFDPYWKEHFLDARRF